MPSPDFIRPTYLYKKQHDAVFCPHRWALVEAGTKTGATTACIAWLSEQGFAGGYDQNYWWISSSSSQALAVYNRVKSGLTIGSFIAQESPIPKIIIANGAIIWFKSGDKPTSLIDEDVYAAVIDNPAYCKEESWFSLRATLTATEGPARIAGRVRGKDNWFYHFARRAESGGDPNAHYTKLTILDAIEAGIITQSEVDDARRNLPELIFRELYMAEPYDGRLEQMTYQGDPRRLPDEELELIAGCKAGCIETPATLNAVNS